MKKINMQLFLVLLILFLLYNCSKIKSPISSFGSGNKMQLTSSGFDYYPYLSPDGNYVTFRSARNTFDPTCSAIFSEFWIIDSSKRIEKVLISKSDKEITNQGIVDVFDIDWFPDSNSMLAEIRIDFDKSEIWQVHLNGDKKRITSQQNYSFKPSCSPNGLKIAYIIRDPQTTTQGSPIWHLVVANPNGTQEIILESGLCDDYTWSHDSNGLFYSIYDRDKNNSDLWYASIDGIEKHPISDTKFDEGAPSCSYNGKYLAYNAQDSLFITSIDSFKPQNIFHNAYKPRWINNFDLLLITYNENEYTETGDIKYWINESWIIDLSGKIIRRIEEGNSTRVSFSKSGKYFAYSLNGNIWIDQFWEN